MTGMPYSQLCCPRATVQLSLECYWQVQSGLSWINDPAFPWQRAAVFALYYTLPIFSWRNMVEIIRRGSLWEACSKLDVDSTLYSNPKVGFDSPAASYVEPSTGSSPTSQVALKLFPVAMLFEL